MTSRARGRIATARERDNETSAPAHGARRWAMLRMQCARSGCVLALLASGACGHGAPVGAGTTSSVPASADGDVARLRDALAERDQRLKQLESRIALVEAEQRQFRYALAEREEAPVVAVEREPLPKRSRGSANSLAGTAPMARPESSDADAPRAEARRPMLRLYEDGSRGARDPVPMADVPVVSERLAVVPLPTASALLVHGAAQGGHASASADDTYARALDALGARDFRSAASAFERFIDEHPRDARVAKATFWRAEALFAQQSYAAARAGFDAYLARDPGGDRAADALLKLGHCHARAGERERAQAAFSRLKREFPDSPAARMAAQEDP